MTTFTTAPEAGRMAGAKAANIIKDQCGYRRGEVMSIQTTTTGGKRLFVAVAGRWMDGSLNDINDKSINALL